MALSVGVGLGVLADLMEAEVTGVVGPKGRHDPERAAVRHGHEAGEVTLGEVAAAHRAPAGASHRRLGRGRAVGLPPLGRPRSA